MTIIIQKQRLKTVGNGLAAFIGSVSCPPKNKEWKTKIKIREKTGINKKIKAEINRKMK